VEKSQRETQGFVKILAIQETEKMKDFINRRINKSVYSFFVDIPMNLKFK
jgi:hypothetical protein